MTDYELPQITEFTGNAERAQEAADRQVEIDRQLQQQDDETNQEREKTAADVAQSEDPRSDGVGWNPGDIGAELTAAVGGGLQDSASSIVTLGERTVDMFNGEMAEEGDDYRPEWDPFTDHDNPIETKTIWGGVLRGLVHFGSLAVGTIAAAKGGAVVAGGLGLTKVAGGLSWLGAGGAKATALGRLGQGALIGGAGDVVSRDSQKENALGALKKMYPSLDTPLATNDTDHPAMKTFKSVVEGFGGGAIFDLALEAAGYGVKAVGRKIKNKPTEEVIAARNKSVKDQTIERGKAEVEETTEFRGHKNKPIADSHQGNPTSNGSVDDVKTQVNRIEREAGAESGSTDSLVSARANQMMNQKADDMGDAAHYEVKKALESDPDFKAKVNADKDDLRSKTKSYKEIAEEDETLENIAAEMLYGKNLADVNLTPQELFKDFNDRANLVDGELVWRSADVKTAALINYTLLKEVRNTAIGARTIADAVDIGDIDGPVDALKEKLLYAYVQSNRSTKMWSESGKQLQDAKTGLNTRKTKAQIKEELINDKADIKESVDSLFEMARKGATDDNLKKLMEVFSGSDVNNFDDYKKFLLTKLKGGELKGGKHQTGIIFKELASVFTHSVLSGPKTVVRAISGTGMMSFLRPLSQATGALMRGDITTSRASLAESQALLQTIPEAFKIFKTRLNSLWTGDVADINTRFSSYNQKNDEVWSLLADYMENGTDVSAGDRAAFYVANISRMMNQSNFLTYSTKMMDAGDKAFDTLMMRARIRGKATREAIESAGDVTPQAIKDAEDRFLRELTDADGNIDIEKIKANDPELYNAQNEVKLTTELSGFAKSMDEMFNKHAWAKPFFLFARTGVNGIAMAGKHTPGVNLLLKKQRAILTASADNLAPVMKYGINNAADLANAKALSLGRQAMGAGIIMMVAQMHMNGDLRGSGPVDRSLRNAWVDAGYKRNTVRVGKTWINFESFEPFNQLITLTSDIMDHSQLMGEEWTENRLQQMVAIVMEGLTSKSYLSGLQDMVDFASQDPRSGGRILGGILNNTVPMSSMRNELGKLFSPYTRELNSDVWTSIRNRNQLTELGGDSLPIKYDLLNGKEIRQMDFPTRMFNMFSPLQFNLDGGPGRQFLFDSNYDLRLSVQSMNGISFKENAVLRSEFQRLIGEQNLEAELDKLAKDPKMQNSLNNMNNDFRKDPTVEPKDYPHYTRINNLFEAAKQKAWAKMKQRDDVKALLSKEQNNKAKAAKNKQKVINQNSLLKLTEYPN